MAIEALKEGSRLYVDAEVTKTSRPWPLADESRSNVLPSPPDLLVQHFAQTQLRVPGHGPLTQPHWPLESV